MKTLIFGGHVIDPANKVDAFLNLLVEDGKIAWAGKEMPEADRLIDALEQHLETRVEELNNEEI